MGRARHFAKRLTLGILPEWSDAREDGCWIWKYAKNSTGYPHVKVDFKPIKLCRLILKLKTGEDGVGLEACHTCDVPSCVNPDHLFWGTKSQNMQQRWDRYKERLTTAKDKS